MKHMQNVTIALLRQFNESAPIRATYNTRDGYERALAASKVLQDLRATERAYKVATHYAYG